MDSETKFYFSVPKNKKIKLVLSLTQCEDYNKVNEDYSKAVIRTIHFPYKYASKNSQTNQRNGNMLLNLLKLDFITLSIIVLKNIG